MVLYFVHNSSVLVISVQLVCYIRYPILCLAYIFNMSPTKIITKGIIRFNNNKEYMVCLLNSDLFPRNSIS